MVSPIIILLLQVVFQFTCHTKIYDVRKSQNLKGFLEKWFLMWNELYIILQGQDLGKLLKKHFFRQKFFPLKLYWHSQKLFSLDSFNYLLCLNTYLIYHLIIFFQFFCIDGTIFQIIICVVVLWTLISMKDYRQNWNFYFNVCIKDIFLSKIFLFTFSFLESPCLKSENLGSCN